MAGGVAPIDFWSVFNASADAAQRKSEADRQHALQDRQIKMQETQFSQEQQQRAAQAEQARLEREGVAEFVGSPDQPSNPEKLRRVAPMKLWDLTKQRSEMELSQGSAQRAQQKTDAERETNTAQFMKLYSDGLAKNPGAAEFFERVKQKKIQDKAINDFQTPEQAMPNGLMGPGPIDAAAMGREAQLGLPPPDEINTLDPIAKNVINQFGYAPNTPEFRKAYGIAKAEEERAELARRRAGASQVNVGTGQAGIETATKAKLEQDIVTARDLISRIDDVEKGIDTDLVGYQGMSGEKMGAAIDYFGAPAEAIASAVGLDPKKQLEILDRRQKIKSQVRDLGDLVIRVRSGANAPETEQKNLKSIYGDIDNMGEVQLRRALRTFRESLSRQTGSKADVIAQGVRVAPGKRVPNQPTPEPTTAPDPVTPPQQAPPNIADAINARTDLNDAQKQFLLKRAGAR
jgi:hypothetical protein